jgi:hypothetical protein
MSTWVATPEAIKRATRPTGVTMTDKRDKCAHPPCTCTAGSDSKYCSPHCETAKNTTELSCDCGHGGCGGKL